VNLSFFFNVSAVLMGGTAVYCQLRWPMAYGTHAILLAFTAGLVIGLADRWAVSIQPDDPSAPRPAQGVSDPSQSEPTPRPVRHTPKTPLASAPH